MQSSMVAGTFFCRDENNGEIDLLRNGTHRGKTGQCLNFRILRIYGVYTSGVASDEVFQYGVTSFEWIGSCANDSDSVRIEKKVHYVSSCVKSYGLMMITSRYCLPHFFASFSLGKKMSIWSPFMAAPLS